MGMTTTRHMPLWFNCDANFLNLCRVPRVIRYNIRAVESGRKLSASQAEETGRPGLVGHRALSWCGQGEVAPMNEPLIEMLSCVTDCRRGQAKRYRLANILMFCILGFLCGAKSYKSLCSFIEERFALLQAAFPSSMKRAPAPSTLWRIIGLVDGTTLEAVFRRHAVSQHAALGGGPGEVVAHDGKSLRGSYDTASETKMSQLLRAFAVGTRIILGHVAILVKSNEIPAMQALVRELGLAEVLCTADAMHCQIQTIAAVKASGGEALLKVKSNQPSLEAAFDALPLQHEPADCHVETGKIRRNRQEKRVVEVFRAGRLLERPEWRTDVVEAVCVTRPVQRQGVSIRWEWRGPFP